MNRIFPLILLLFVLTSCYKSDSDKAHDLVKTYCDNNFFSPEDYKPISFENLKPYYKPYEQSTEYIALDNKRQVIESTKDSLYAKMYKGNKDKLYEQRIDSLDKAVVLINMDISTGKQNFKGQQLGWTIRHSYSKKDESGRIVEGWSVFLVDKGLTKVLQVTDE
jgi:hypothetical protein